MIRTSKKFCCEDFSLIENYNLALNDETNVWECHHRREIDENKTAQQLKDEGLYYNRPACELIFLHPTEHRKLHTIWNKGVPMKDNEEYYKNFCEAMSLRRGKDTWMKGKKHTEESKKLISEHNWTKNPEYKDKIKEMSKKISATLKGHADWAHGAGGASRRKPVLKIDLEGNVVEKYESLTAAQKNNKGRIIVHIQNNTHTRDGYYYKYAS